jgi:hypothetical protein
MMMMMMMTLVLRRHTLQTKKFVTHKPDEQSSKNRLCTVATSLLAVGTVSYKQWILGVFYQGVNQSKHEADKISSVVLRLHEVSLNVPWH